MVRTYYDKDGERQTPYVEDSTRGGARVAPLNYKGDALIQVWIDSRILSTLSHWLESNDFYPRFLSEVVREPLRVLVETLVENGSVEMVEHTAEARTHLSTRYGTDLTRGGRGQRNALHNQVLSDKRIELGERIGRRSQRVYVANPAISSIKWIPLEGYEKEYLYPEGDEEAKQRLIKQLEINGVKSFAQMKAEAMSAARAAGHIVEENDGKG